METLISVKRAKQLLNEHIVQANPLLLSIKDALGLKLANDISSPRNVPDFMQSSMDGYAIQFDQNIKEYKIVGQIQAGEQSRLSIQHAQAVRIFTGAPLPIGADTVVVQEKVSIQNDSIILEEYPIKKGDHVRAVGSEIPKNAVALERGMVLNAAAIGVIASLGYELANVFAPPSVSIIITGDEIKKPGESISTGQVYDASSFSLSSVLKKIGCNKIEINYVKDHLTELTSVLKHAISSSDLVLVTGGVSVGDYDFTKQAFDTCGVKSVFHKIKQKPGKPILFGIHGTKPVFGLPGNPASVLTCFYEYVYPAIGKMIGQKFSLQSVMLPLSHDFSKNKGLTHFLKASVENNKVKILTGQESYKISSFARANAFVVLEEEVSEVKAGDEVEVHLIPF